MISHMHFVPCLTLQIVSRLVLYAVKFFFAQEKQYVSSVQQYYTFVQILGSILNGISFSSCVSILF